MGSDQYSISGRVFDEQTQQSASHVEVTLREPGGVMRAQVITNESGRFDFGSVSRGSYEIAASATGYEPSSTSVSVGGGATRGMTIYLKRTANLQPASSSSISAHELSMPKKARDLMYSGKQKIFYGKNPQAGLADLQNAVAIAPDYYEAYYQIGMTFLELGKHDDAEKNFQKSIELSKDRYGEPVIGMGTLLLNKGDNAGGEKTIRRGLELSPYFWLGYYELGRACLAENHLAEAKKAGEQARSLMPTAGIVYRLLANVHMREKDYPALLEDIDTYVKIDPDSPAGIHAKEMRAEVVQKIQDEKVVLANAEPK
ncbi:MAG: carboxypeptidase regulatory-like domain-containing protein [Candidatus Acidiferrales bacterium]